MNKEIYTTTYVVGQSGDAGLEMNWLRVIDEVFRVFVGKHHDYGPKNIEEIGLFGITALLRSKIARLENLLPEQRPAINESIRDTVVDIIDYGVIFLLVLDKLWPVSDEKKENIATISDYLVREIRSRLDAVSQETRSKIKVEIIRKLGEEI